MKFLVVFALAVAVAQAGFTGSLHQRVQPQLQRAMQQIRAELAVRMPARSSAEVAVQAKFLQNLQDQILQAINDIQMQVSNAQIMVEGMMAHVQTATEALHALGANAVSEAQQVMQNLMTSLMQNLNLNGRALPPFLQQMVASVVESLVASGVVHATSIAQCLSTDAGLEVSWETVQTINADKPDGWRNFLADPAVRACIDKEGGMTAMIAGSDIVGGIMEMVAPLGLTNLVQGLVQSAVDPADAAAIMAGLAAHKPQGRGFFGSLASNALGAVTSGLSAAGHLVSSMASNVVGMAGSAFSDLQDTVKEWAMEQIGQIASMALEEALPLMMTLSGMAGQLGDAWGHAQDAFAAVHGAFNLAN